MRSDSVKVFRDPVHGYIEVPSIIVKEIIDTKQFQRLRFIEQTSMRALFPAARHDRFVHSLGTYWLGVKAFKGFQSNSDIVLNDLIKDGLLVNDNDDYKNIDSAWWKKHELLFQIACLMHDCAHAPFSHTLEDYYKLPIIQVNKKAYSKLSWNLCSICEKLGDKSFQKDFYEAEYKSTYYGVGKQHEQMSSYVTLAEYYEAIQKIFKARLPEVKLKDEDYVFICRAIIGCKYSSDSTTNSLKNCMISLLNSELIDVDGLDYIVRDAQMSGMSAYDVDYQRLLNSFTILPVNVLDNVEINGSIDGLWLKDSKFYAENMKDCTVHTAALLITGNLTYKERLKGAGFEPFESATETGNDNCFEFSPTANKSSVRIEGIPYFEMGLISSGRITNSLFSGKIKGKRIIENEFDNQAGHPISFILAYDKRCLSIIQNTINARNDEYLWVYSHPKVMYCANYLQCELLKLSAKYLCCKCNNPKFACQKLDFDCDNCDAHNKNGKNFERFITHVLGYDFLLDATDDNEIKQQLQQRGFFFSRTNDDDLNALFKRISLENDSLGNNKSDKISKVSDEYFARKHKSVLWKSYFEYKAICKMLDDSSAHRNFDELLEDYAISLKKKNEHYAYLNEEDHAFFEKIGCKDDVIVIVNSANTKSIQVAEFFVKYEDRVEQLSKLYAPNMAKEATALGLRFIFADADKKWNHQAIKDMNDILDTRRAKRI